jgi:hypothetical protein
MMILLLLILIIIVIILILTTTRIIIIVIILTVITIFACSTSPYSCHCTHTHTHSCRRNSWVAKYILRTLRMFQRKGALLLESETYIPITHLGGWGMKWSESHVAIPDWLVCLAKPQSLAKPHPSSLATPTSQPNRSRQRSDSHVAIPVWSSHTLKQRQTHLAWRHESSYSTLVAQ